MASVMAQSEPERRKLMDMALYDILTEDFKKVLQVVLGWGTRKRNPGQCFSDYLIKVKNLSRTRIRKGFNKKQRNKLDKDPDTSTFDVTLLCLCIQYGCDDLAPPKDNRWVEQGNTLERSITSIKDHRNDFMHEEYSIDDEKAFLDKVEELRDLLNVTLKQAGEIYNIDESEVESLLKKVNDDISSVRDRPLDASAEHLRFEMLRISVYIDGKKELKKVYGKISSISPCSNLINNKVRIRVDKIFTKMTIIREGAWPNGSHEQLVSYHDFLEHVEMALSQTEKSSSVLLVEGPAGSGKTTLTRKMLSDWASGSTTMKHLCDYDFAIWNECRDGNSRSLGQLLYSLMPKVSTKFHSKYQVVEAIQQNQLLFIVDGLDEMNPASEQVLRDILALGEHVDITVLCTTRPNKVPDFKRFVPDIFNIFHVKITGIPNECREDFVRNYSTALQSEVGNKDISGLLQYLRRRASRLFEHLRLPFNLVLLTVLWFLNDDVVNEMTTPTELFMRTLELCQRRVVQRLLEHGDTRTWSRHDINQKMERFFVRLCAEAVVNHCNDEIVLPKDSVERLKDTCTILKLPPEEVLGCFLIQTTSLTDETQGKYSFPHKGVQDFLCAIHIQRTVLSDGKELDVPRLMSCIKVGLLECNVSTHIEKSVLDKTHVALREVEQAAAAKSRSIRNALEEARKESALYSTQQVHTVHSDLASWQNILLHLTALLFHNGPVSDQRTAEVVQLLGESGIRESDQWLDFLSNIKRGAAISRHIVLRHEVKVTDGRVDAFLGAMSHTKPSKVIVDIANEPLEVPHLRELLVALRDRPWEVEMWFRHDFRHPDVDSSRTEGFLEEIFSGENLPMRLSFLRGRLSCSIVSRLPSCMKILHLAIKDEAHYKSLLPALASLKERMPRLNSLGFHIPAGLDESTLRPLPHVSRVSLRMSNVDVATVEWACRAARALQPSERNGYFFLILPGVLSNEETYESLLEGFVQMGVSVKFKVLASPLVAGRKRLEGITKRRLGCSLEMREEEDMW